MKEIALGLLVTMLMLSVACSDDGTTPEDSGPKPDAAMTEGGSGTEAGADQAVVDQGSGGDAASCDPVSLEAEAMSQGTKVLNGVTLSKSTPIADILADTAKYDGQTVRIEGVIVEICQTQGCYVTLQDPDGKKINLKVTDGTLDFRNLCQTGQYAVGEGVFTIVGEHGSQVSIMNHGAMIGKSVCSI